MTHKALIVLLACVAGAGLIFVFHTPRNRPTPATANASPTAARSTIAPAETTPSSAPDRKGVPAPAKPADDVVMLAPADHEDTATARIEEQRRTRVEEELLKSMAELAEQLKTNPELIGQAMEMLRQERDPEAMRLIAAAIGEAAEALGARFPREELMKMAESDPSMPRRQAAILALAYMKDVPPDMRLRIAEISRTAPLNEIRMTAVDCIGSWMNRNPTLKPRMTETLLDSLQASDDPMVRGIVLQTIGNTDAPLTPKVLDAMSAALLNEPEAHNRSLAAVALGSCVAPDTRETILTTLGSAYVDETNIDTQRHIITQIVKAARADAPQYLNQLPTEQNPLLAQDVKDYIDILGKVDPGDWDAVWGEKSDRDEKRGTYPGAQTGP